MARTPFFGRQTPGGGVLLFDDESNTTGSYFFVHSGTGTDKAGAGQGPDSPAATADFMVASGTASLGDTIVCMPGHAESLASATGLAIDVAGIRLLGLGWGNLRPTFTLDTATGATIAVTAPSCVIDNIKIVSDFADVAAGITASALADGLIVRNCWLKDGSSTKELVIGISIAAACNNVAIYGNRFTTVDGGGCASAIKLVGAADDSEIFDNYIHGDYSVACIDGATAAAVDLDIHHNRFWNTDTGAGLLMSMHASTTGIYSDNRSFGGKNDAHYTAAGMAPVENYSTNAADASGLIKPAVDS